jgi:ATP-dependent DNA helicase DinG
MREAVVRALSAGGVLAGAHPGFVPRSGQQDLAAAIASAIESATPLIAEAGTGTGKTFAYLVPALLSGGRVMIATGTRNLQDQLFERDLPLVRDALGVRADVALLKGRSNYVCRHHLARNLADGRFGRREDIVDLRRIDQFAKVSASGDRAALSTVAEDAPAWSLATSTRENCLGQDCPDFDRCFVFKARQAALVADVVVVNHHLFCADLALRDEGVAELLPSTSAVIFDEAHQLPDVATQFFGSAVSSRQLNEFARDALRCGLAEAKDSADWVALHGQLEQAIRDFRMNSGATGRLDQAAIRNRPAMLESVRGCAIAVAIISGALDSAAQRGGDIGRCALRAAELHNRLTGWLVDFESGSDSDAGSVDDESDSGAVDAALEGRILWADVSATGCTLHSTPLSIAKTFQRHLEQHSRAWIFLSATLAVNGSLDYFAAAMGLQGATQIVWPSPFDFATQSLLYVPAGLGDASSPAFPKAMIDAVWPLIRVNRGRAFVLCTTLKMVEWVAVLLAQRIDESGEPFELLLQGRAPRAELLERFRRYPAPVLVGSASFWEGVDVPGQQLSLVIIDKLPFAPPDDPIVRARSEAARRQGLDSFRRVHLPAAAMALKQGAGRLIRSEQDRGVLVICDERLALKPYGRSLLKSLPPFRRTRELDEVLEFLQSKPVLAPT